MNYYDIENMADYMEEIEKIWKEVHEEEEKKAAE